MKETVETIMRWHKETFPDATLEGQVGKFIGEANEVLMTVGPDVMGRDSCDHSEMADMFIVACGVARFSMQDFVFGMSTITTYMQDYNVSVVDLETAVQKKMKINRQRKWDKKDGQYQHKED